ncbi:MAG: UbiA prenyltransferase family protein [Nanoarchaeota archaeon]|nr:UbiA prenyltransferase family protein [Nanoarchaeota archaeon]MBU1028044.1 UbiA prenyltransferase family protein [Nanoarchaeota archaeon]
MLQIKDSLRLLRVEQWYKNLIIFISLIFSLNLFNKEFFFLTILGFISLCFISSSYYIINDLLDIKKDQNHPEKNTRPIASGKIKKNPAIITSVVLFVLSLLIASFLGGLFLYSILLLFILSQIYNLDIRNIPYLDIIFISLNFVIRAVSGTFIIKSPVSIWVILITFFLSIFLVSSKRSLEIMMKGIKKYRPNFTSSDKKILEILSIISIACVFVFFSIYSVLNFKPTLLLSVPIALYIVIMFFQNLYNSPEKIRNPEKFIFDKKIILALLFWLIIIIFSFYYLPN